MRVNLESLYGIWPSPDYRAFKQLANASSERLILDPYFWRFAAYFSLDLSLTILLPS
jgi:hypothetical protein